MYDLAKDPDTPKMDAVFISIDPKRDTPDVMKMYCEDFHPNLTGATGSVEDVESICRKYRVYYQPHEALSDGDFQIDHTIITYLLNPNNKIMGFFGKSKTRENIVENVKKSIKAYESDVPTIDQLMWKIHLNRLPWHSEDDA